MGGTKKKSISQMEKQQKLKEERERKEKEKKERERKRQEKAERDRSARILVASKQQVEEILKEAADAGLVTPFSVASRLNVKLSIAKLLLRDVESRGLIRLVAKSPRTLIYAPVTPATATGTR